MKLRLENYLFILIFLMVVFPVTLKAQDNIVGRIVSKSEADAKFGDAINTITDATPKLQNWLNSSGTYIMFNIKNNQLCVLGDGRSVIYPAGAAVDSSEVFHLYSKSKVLELLSLGVNSLTSFEVRKEVFSVTCGDFTLEWGTPCPPYCF